MSYNTIFWIDEKKILLVIKGDSKLYLFPLENFKVVFKLTYFISISYMHILPIYFSPGNTMNNVAI